MRPFSRSAFALVIVAGGIMLSMGASVPQPKLVVHEWGVMIRRTQTQLAPPDELLASLPGFVLRHDEHYKPTVPQPYGNGTHIWYKPVIHFYGPEGQAVDATIRTPKGRPLVYWPEPEILAMKQQRQPQTRGVWIPGSTKSHSPQAQGMQWKGVLTIQRPLGVPKVRDEHWWKTARDVPSMYVKTDKGSERFIFYEGTAKSQPSVTAAFAQESLRLVNSDQHESGPVVLIISDRDVHYAHYIESLPANRVTHLSKSEVCDEPVTPDELLAICQRQWEAHGMSAAEAKSIVEIWKEDLLRPVGCLLISRIPPATYDSIFPLEIKPMPSELVRVGLVFDLVDDSRERIHWLPRTQRHLRELTAKLDSEDFHVRERAFDEIVAHADLGESVAKSLVGHKDPEVNWRAKVLLHRIALGRQKQPIPNMVPVQYTHGQLMDGKIIHQLEELHRPR